MNNIRVWCAVVVCVIGTLAYGGDITVEGDLTVQSNLVVQQDMTFTNTLSIAEDGVLEMQAFSDTNSGYYYSRPIVFKSGLYYPSGIGTKYLYADEGGCLFFGSDMTNSSNARIAMLGNYWEHDIYLYASTSYSRKITFRNGVMGQYYPTIYYNHLYVDHQTSNNNALFFYDGYTSTTNIIFTPATDGSGSGLDADTLDGFDSSTFVKVDDSVVSGDLVVQSNLVVQQDVSISNSLSCVGSVTAEEFYGDGAGITNLPATASDAFVKKVGDTMSGDLNMDDNRIRNVSTNGITINGFDGEYTMWREDTSLEGLRSDYSTIAFGDLEINNYIRFNGHGVIGLEEYMLFDDNDNWVVHWGEPESPLAIHQNLSVTGEVTAVKFIGDGSALTGIQGSSIAAGTISESQLAYGVVTSDKIADNAVMLSDLNAEVDAHYLTKADPSVSGKMTITNIMTARDGSDNGQDLIIGCSDGVGMGDGGNLFLRAGGVAPTYGGGAPGQIFLQTNAVVVGNLSVEGPTTSVDYMNANRVISGDIRGYEEPVSSQDGEDGGDVVVAGGQAQLITGSYTLGSGGNLVLHAGDGGYCLAGGPAIGSSPGGDTVIRGGNGNTGGDGGDVIISAGIDVSHSGGATGVVQVLDPLIVSNRLEVTAAAIFSYIPPQGDISMGPFVNEGTE